MAEITENIENSNFRLKAVAELLDGEHHFYIPSYQRGYRWDDRQVEDLLKDIWDFARNDEKKKTDFYCLQPIVVKIDKQNNKWIVIDGQQRLRTLQYFYNGIFAKTRKVDVVEIIVAHQFGVIAFHRHQFHHFLYALHHNGAVHWGIIFFRKNIADEQFDAKQCNY